MDVIWSVKFSLKHLVLLYSFSKLIKEFICIWQTCNLVHACSCSHQMVLHSKVEEVVLQLKTEGTIFFHSCDEQQKGVGWQNTHICLGFSWHSSRIWLKKLYSGVLRVKYFSKFCKWKVTSFTIPRKCKNFQNFYTVKCSCFEKVHALGMWCPIMQLYTPEDLNLQQHHCENFKSLRVWSESGKCLQSEIGHWEVPGKR